MLEEHLREDAISYAKALGWSPAKFYSHAVGVILAMLDEPGLRVVPGVCSQVDALRQAGILPSLPPGKSSPVPVATAAAENIIPFPSQGS